MKRILLLLFTIVPLSSCEIQYDGETRIVAEGQVVDRNNNPIPDQKIEITTNAEGTYGSTDLISFTTTNQDGRFSLVFPSPKGQDISIETFINSDQRNKFQSKIIKGLKKNFINYKLNLNQIVLYEINDFTELELVLNKTSPNKQISSIKIDGIQPDYLVDLNADKNENQFPGKQFNVLKNQTINLSYTLSDFSDPGKVVTTNHTSVITINSEKVVHSITY
jgi:outer membrane lipopolysaccharide assembly protein LptE/RlpB